MHQAGALLAAVLAGLAAARDAAATYPTLELPTFTLAHLEVPDAATLAQLATITQELGLFAVTVAQQDSALTTVPGSEGSTLGEFVHCYSQGALDGSLNQVLLGDETVRRTLATATVRDAPEPLLTLDAARACPRFAQAAGELRASVNRVGHAYAAILDRLVYKHNPSRDDGAAASPAGPFLSAVRTADSLEHFHVFERMTPQESADLQPSAQAHRKLQQLAEHGGDAVGQGGDVGASGATGHAAGGRNAILPMHSDVGVFLVMTAAEVFDLRTGQPLRALAPSLLLQLPSGQVVRPRVHPGALLVMNGEGSTLWMPPSPPTAARPYAPAHEVGPVEGMQGGVQWARAWFGRMFFPPADALPRSAAAPASGALNMTFGEYRQRTYEAFRKARREARPDSAGVSALKGAGPGHEMHREAELHDWALASAGCSPLRRRLADEGSCGANEVYCWMRCMAMPPDATCSTSQVQCVNPKDGTIWPRDYMVDNKPTHCMSCTLKCPMLPPSNSTSPPLALSSSFCNTRLQATSMWMTGFQFAQGHSNYPCVVFLFPEWVLDTRLKFGWACVGTFLMGLVVGALTRARALVRALWPAKACAHSLDDSRSQGLHTASGHLLVVLLAAVQLTFGYFLMLIAMTYQAELFICVVLGLATGVLFTLLELGASAARGGGGRGVGVELDYVKGKGEEVGLQGKGGAMAADRRSSSGDGEEHKLDPCC